MRVHNTSGFKGVCWAKHISKWRVMVSVHGKTKSLGSYSCPIHAASVYDAWALEHYGEFAVTNAALGRI